jgi:hypothetical protein
MHVANYLGLVDHAERNLAAALREVAAAHGHEPDVMITCRTLAKQCDAHVGKLASHLTQYGEQGEDEPDRLHTDLFQGTRSGGLGLLRDLHDLYLMATNVDISWVVLGQAAQGLRDTELLATIQACDAETSIQVKWVKTRMKQAAPQTLIAAS